MTQTFNKAEHIREEHGISVVSSHLKEIVYGGTDGIVTTFAVVAGFAGVNSAPNVALPIMTVLLFGLANLFADGLSMGLGDFLSQRAENEMFQHHKSIELAEIKTNPDHEAKETIDLLVEKGFAKEDAKALTEIYQKNPDYWAEKDVLSGALIFQKIGQYGAAMRLLLSNGYPLHTKDKGICKSFTQYYYPRPHWAIVQLEALERNINPNFSLAIMREESTFNPQAKSGSGAMGLMQLMPKTAEGIAKSLKISKFHTRDLYKPETNIQFGSYYLGFLSRKFNAHPLWMAAGYNAGPNAAQRWKDRWLGASDEVILERIPYPETNAYAKRVLRSFFIYSLLAEEGADTVSSKPSNTTHQ